MKKIIIFIIPILLIVCKKEREAIQLDFSPEMQSKLDESKKIILSYSKDEYIISNGSNSPEEAIRKFIDNAKIESNLDKNPYFLTATEQEKVMYPNIYGTGTALDVTPLEDYNKMISKRAGLGYEKLNTKLKSISSIKTIDIKFSPPKLYKKIEGLKPKIRLIDIRNNTLYIEEIKMVFKVGDLYKVGVIAP